jgi:hypothetical protein
MGKLNEATLRWACTLIAGVVLTPLHCLSVWSARRSALDVNSIELAQWWYLFALAGPLLSVTSALLLPRSNWIWHRSLFFNILAILTVASFAHIPLMYSAGGFQ